MRSLESNTLPRILPLLTLSGILLAAATYFVSSRSIQEAVWAAITTAALLALGTSVARQVIRREPGVDIIALLAMGGALALGQYLAGAVIAVMLAGGRVLESYAAFRARRELTALLRLAPRVVHRYEQGKLASPDIEQVQPGDLLLIKPGEAIPVDGVVEGGAAVLDESTLTGEAKPVRREAGERVHSGALNAGAPFDLRAVATAAKSTYAGIIRLVRQAEQSKAPLVRMADRFALLFLPLALLIAGAAWMISGDPARVLAVLVVATPCPLILAAPVALICGMSSAAGRGIIFKGGGALETLARARTLLLDKTGTLTIGIPVLADIEAFGNHSGDDLLRLAASLDQVSPHVFAGAIVRAAHEQGAALAFPGEVVEQPGSGIQGKVEGHWVALGNGEWVSGGAPLPAAARRVRARTALEGSSNVFVAIDGAVAGALIIENPIRAETPRTIRALRRTGIRRIVVLTGDHPDLADIVGAAIGADEVLAERTPEEKVEAVRVERARGPVIMVGDGVNDAPALAAADVGVAMGARGAGASSQAADVVLAVDRLDRLVEALRIARRSRSIAVQSIVAGMGLSVGAMGLALAGLLSPIPGAFLQEAIDIAVILNALRALRTEGLEKLKSPEARQNRDRVRAEHQSLLPKVKRLRAVADRLDLLAPGEARLELEGIRRFLFEELIPHETAEDLSIYPVVAKLIGGDDPTGTMSRAHLEIVHLTRLFARLVEDLPEEGPASADLRDLRRVLYGLDALLRLHFAQEEEHFLSLMDEHLAEQPARKGPRL